MAIDDLECYFIYDGICNKGDDWINFQKSLSKTNLIMALATIIAVVGAWLNVLKNPLCFILWMCSNLIFLAAAYLDKERWMSLVFLTYFGTSAWGLWSW